MGQNAIMTIILLVFIIAFVIYSLVNKKMNKKGKNEKTDKKEGYKGKSADVPKKDMSAFIRFDKIANDMIYQNKGEKYTMVIECKGINYELMSDVEQMAVEEGFITFLNTLKFPIQLYVQTRSIDLSNNIKRYKERVNEFEEKRQEAVNQYNRAENDIDVSQEEINDLRRQKIKYTNISEYVSDITKYVERLSLNKYLLQRKFYVVLSYNKSEIVSTEKFSNEEYEELCYRELYTRAQGMIGSLMACSVKGRILNSNELAELIYISLNKDDEKTLSIRTALESGFYRLYSTSEDVRVKRQEALDEEIKQQSLKRIEEAIKEGIEKGTIVTSEVLEDRLDKEIDTSAIKLVDESSMNGEVKEEIKNIIMTNRKARLKEKEERNRAKEEDKKDAKEETVDIHEDVAIDKSDKVDSDDESIV